MVYCTVLHCLSILQARLYIVRRGSNSKYRVREQGGSRLDGDAKSAKVQECKSAKSVG